MGRATSSSSSSIESSTHFGFPSNGASSSSSSQRDLSTDLRLGLSISASRPYAREQPSLLSQVVSEEENECNSATFFVKVYMEGIPIGAEPEAEMDGDRYEKYHVLTYEDKEGDWMMVGDVPW
ncbi:hypothetical protein Gohar_015388, partial [Gossypium harknessii]|nr:hypothetical protein [Gossypium harknessii]